MEVVHHELDSGVLLHDREMHRVTPATSVQKRRLGMVDHLAEQRRTQACFPVWAVQTIAEAVQMRSVEDVQPAQT